MNAIRHKLAIEKYISYPYTKISYPYTKAEWEFLIQKIGLKVFELELIGNFTSRGWLICREWAYKRERFVLGL